MIPNDLLHETAQRMFAAAVSSRPDQSRRQQVAMSADYWRSLCLELNVEGEDRPAQPDGPELTEVETAEIARSIAADGYFQKEGVVPPRGVRPLRRCVETLRRSGWPPVFSFVYDEFWRATRARPVLQAARHLLGPGARQIPHFCTHFVAGHRGAAGWQPHMDGRSRLRRISAWMALSDATLDNGCMYVIPRSAVPPHIADGFESLSTINWSDARALLQNCRALPCGAGTLLGWEWDVIHWGAACRRATNPRISISFEFIAGDETPRDDELPLLEIDPNRLPPFSERLKFIGRAILAYERFDVSCAGHLELAERLTDGDRSMSQDTQRVAGRHT